MKIYYIPEININNLDIDIDSLNIYKKNIQKIIITPYGRIKVGKNEKKEKLIVKDSYQINNFLQKYTLLVNDINWSKTPNGNITNENYYLEKTVYDIKISENSNTIMVIEYIDKKIHDIFFKSKNDPETIFFKNDISSFIKMLI
tara:strand:+ start:354 stop:785 length:432 start_codon:yes stop_codon:yes gene_type:complete